MDGVPVHKLDTTAGAAAMIARRAEREAEMQRKKTARNENPRRGNGEWRMG